MSKVKIIGETSIDKDILEAHITKLIKGRLMVIKTELTEINDELAYYTKRYQLANEEFLQKFNAGALGDEEDFFMWEGSLKVRRKLLEEQQMLSEII